MSFLKRIMHLLLKPFAWFKRTRRRNKVFAIIVLIIVGSIIGTQIQNATAKPPYETQKAKVEDIVQLVSETGNVSTGGRVDVSSTATGVIEELYVQNGDTVELNQPLFKVRSTATEQEQATAYASYQSAVSAQKKAEQGKLAADSAMWSAQKLRLNAKEAKRVKDDHKDDYEDLEEQSVDASAVQTEKDFTAAETAYKEADISVVAAKAQVTSTWLAYQATKNAVVKAPTTGSVANLSTAVGDNVTAGGSSALSASAALSGAGAAATPVLTIANLSSDYSIKLALNEVDIPKVKQGQHAIIALDAFTGKKYNGSVTHVDAVGTNTQDVITYNVVVSIHDADSGIKPGMTADVDLEVDKASKVLSVPNSAVKPYKGGRAVRVIDPKTKELQYIPVQIGIKGESKTQIIKGISEGQEIVTALSNEQVKKQSGLF